MEIPTQSSDVDPHHHLLEISIWLLASGFRGHLKTLLFIMETYLVLEHAVQEF